MSIYDADLLLRSGATDLTADELTPASVDFGGPDQHALTYVLIVPEAAATTSVVVTIQESDNDSDWRTVLTFPTVADTDTLPAIHLITAKLDGRYRRYTADVTGTADFGAVIIAPVIGGRYEDF